MTRYEVVIDGRGGLACLLAARARRAGRSTALLATAGDPLVDGGPVGVEAVDAFDELALGETAAAREAAQIRERLLRGPRHLVRPTRMRAACGQAEQLARAAYELVPGSTLPGPSNGAFWTARVDRTAWAFHQLLAARELVRPDRADGEVTIEIRPSARADERRSPRHEHELGTLDRDSIELPGDDARWRRRLATPGFTLQDERPRIRVHAVRVVDQIRCADAVASLLGWPPEPMDRATPQEPGSPVWWRHGDAAAEVERLCRGGAPEPLPGSDITREEVLWLAGNGAPSDSFASLLRRLGVRHLENRQDLDVLFEAFVAARPEAATVSLSAARREFDEWTQ